MLSRRYLLVLLIAALVPLRLLGDLAHSSPQLSTEYRVFLPAITNTRPPPMTASEYITGVTKLEGFNKLGCAAAFDFQRRQGTDGVVILFFGQPAYTLPVGAEPGGYGTRLVRNGGYASIPQIRAAVQAWIDGYLSGYEDATFRCVTPPGELSRITLVIATTNEPLAIDRPLTADKDTPNAGDPDPTVREHGVAWGQLINNLGTYILQRNGSDYLTIGGGNDIELAWNGPTDARAWVDGYYTRAGYRLYVAGACEGCPQSPQDVPSSSIYSHGWTAEDIWTVTTRNNTRVIPQMYNEAGAQARQWATLAAVTRSLGPISYAGALTQFQACLDRGNLCDGVDNTSEVGWLQFAQALAAQGLDPQLPWLTDVRWDFDETPFLKGGS